MNEPMNHNWHLFCVHNQIVTFGLLGRQSVTLNIGLNIGCSHNRNNRPSEQSAKCSIGQALFKTMYNTHILKFLTCDSFQSDWSHITKVVYTNLLEVVHV